MSGALPFFSPDPELQRNLESLQSKFDTGGKSIRLRYGAGTATWAGGSQDTGDATVTHGMGKTPVVVFTQSQTVTAMTRPTTVGPTTFTVKARTLDGSSPAGTTTADFYWLAIG